MFNLCLELSEIVFKFFKVIAVVSLSKFVIFDRVVSSLVIKHKKYAIILSNNAIKNNKI